MRISCLRTAAQGFLHLQIVSLAAQRDIALQYTKLNNKQNELGLFGHELWGAKEFEGIRQTHLLTFHDEFSSSFEDRLISTEFELRTRLNKFS